MTRLRIFSLSVAAVFAIAGLLASDVSAKLFLGAGGERLEIGAGLEVEYRVVLADYEACDQVFLGRVTKNGPRTDSISVGEPIEAEDCRGSDVPLLGGSTFTLRQSGKAVFTGLSDYGIEGPCEYEKRDGKIRGTWEGRSVFARVEGVFKLNREQSNHECAKHQLVAVNLSRVYARAQREQVYIEQTGQ